MTFYWAGYSEHEYRPFDHHSSAQMVGDIAAFEPLPQFHRVLAELRGHSEQARLLAQRRLLDAVDHSVKVSLLVGIIDLARAERLHDFAHRSLESIARMLRSLTAPKRGEPTFDDFVSTLDPATRATFLSVWRTSLFNHGRQDVSGTIHRAFATMPTYIECGFDFLMSGDEPSFSEVQLCSATRPHCKSLVSDAYRLLYPRLIAEAGAEREDYFETCLDLLGMAWSMFSERNRGPTQRTVIDAWSQQAHLGQNHRLLASRLEGFEYRLFDDLVRGSAPSRTLLEATPFNFIYNQPAIHLLDGHHRDFADYYRADIETYPQLGVDGLWQKYREGRVFLSASPLVDVFNDKAMMSFLPEMASFFTGERSSVPVIESEPLWDLDRPDHPASETVARSVRDKDAWVLCHRYLEGGQGIKIGVAHSEAQWRQLFDTYVAERPSHFIVRRYVPMSPAQSLRVPMCGLFDVQDEVAITRAARGLMGRMNAQGPIDNLAVGGSLYWCFVGT